jgi:L-iditol 2-dehydrogenase
LKAAVLSDTHDLRIETIADPSIRESEVLLLPVAVGVCGTDVHILDGNYPAAVPVVLGHEVAARVVALGSEVTSLNVGDLVSVEPHRYCGSCPYCRRGMEHLCTDKVAFGVHVDGGMAELMAAPARNAYRVPEGTSASMAALVEPVSCCVHAMDRLAPLSGLPILIFGCGAAGSILVALAKLAGLGPIVAADTRGDRRQLAGRMGADVVVDPGAADFQSAALDVTSGLGFSYIVDAVGSAFVVESCIRLCARRGTVLVFGVAPPTARASISPNEIYTRELSIVGTAINPFTYSRAIALLGRLQLDRLHVINYGLEEARTAIEATRQKLADKVQIVA